MRTEYWLGVIALTAVVASVVTVRVTAQPTPAPAAAATAAAPVGSIKDVMEGIVDPASDVLFESVSTVSSAAGVKENKPTTDEEWAHVRHNALMLAEAANLLTMAGRHVARPDQPTEPLQPGAPELPPAEIEAKIAQDPALWTKYAHGLQTVAVQAIKAADAKSVEGMYEVGDAIDQACENCHLEYWYPNEKKKG